METTVTRRRGLLFSCIAVGLFLFANNVGATPITIVNPSFELPALPAGSANAGPITGWTQSSTGSGVFHPLGSQLPPPTDGVQTAYVNSGNISQVLSATLQANSDYTLAADFFARIDPCCVWPGSELDFMAGGTVLASAFTAPGALAPGGTQTSTVSFLVGGSPLVGQPLQIRVVNTQGVVQLNVDNVHLDAISNIIPEPASLILVGSVLGGWVARRRMRR